MVEFAFGYSGEDPRRSADIVSVLEGARAQRPDPKVEAFLIQARQLWGTIKRDAGRLCELFHYSHFLTASTLAVGLWRDGDDLPAAACCFTVPPNRVWTYEPMLELVRLVRRPDVTTPLTGLISETVKGVRWAFPDIKLLISYADRTEGHTGWIYQAASWNYAGMRARRVVGYNVDGKFVHNKTVATRYGDGDGTPIIDVIRQQEPGKVVEAVRDQGKHVYWKQLRRGGNKLAAKLKLGRLPYPKEEHEGSRHIQRSEEKEPDLDERL